MEKLIKRDKIDKRETGIHFLITSLIKINSNALEFILIQRRSNAFEFLFLKPILSRLIFHSSFVSVDYLILSINLSFDLLFDLSVFFL